MKCDNCGKEAESGHIIMGQGFSCSEKCSEIMQAERKAFHDELAAEELSEMPEKLDTSDFERWTLKFAVQWIASLDAKARKKIASNNPMYLVPEQLALEFKERILRHIKPAYFSEINYKGHQTLFCGGEYMFRQPVPQEHIAEACRKAELISASWRGIGEV